MKALTKHYKIYNFSFGSYDCLIICLSYESLVDLLDGLKAELNARNVDNGNILIDQLLIAGNGKNRFLNIVFKEGDFILSTAKNVDADYYYHQITASEFKRNPAVLENSILSSRQVALISKGSVI
ncbi:MAG: type II toxin-antitoxin system RnlB family antitoxin [Clostridiales bacterium]|jgi:hypothetical protein|nr:type II toxin-antitoxin system RnlB family antitoxin [Clostridiales bacterium]